jgi:hypothetical protein
MTPLMNAHFTSPGGSVKAGNLGNSLSHSKVAIAKLRLTLPPMLRNSQV